MDGSLRFAFKWGTALAVPGDDAAALARALRALGEAGDPDAAAAAAMILRALEDVPGEATAMLTDVEAEAIAVVLEENPANLTDSMRSLRDEIFLGHRRGGS